ncbi:MAG: thioredoxin family protein [Clostridia bacterium]|nr:thioredoxin family protein [Clostridia bacterium]
MKKITMFTMEACPFCRQALGMIETLRAENPAYADVEIEMIDEVEHPDIADRYDYWYVPTFYVGGEKLHEGVPTPEKVEAVFRAAAGD